MSLTRRSLLAGGAALSSAALLTGRVSATGIELDASPTPWASPVGGEWSFTPAATKPWSAHCSRR